MKLQQFSTPLTISEAAGYAATFIRAMSSWNPPRGLPTWLTGSMDRTDVKVLVNEFDPGRRVGLDRAGIRPDRAGPNGP